MAQVLKEEIKEKIYQTAIEEFYHNDYRSVALLNIAQNAGIPVGLIYRYYKNKADLFDTIVRPIYLSTQHLLSVTAPQDLQTLEYDFHIQTELPIILHMLRTSRKAFIILVDNSRGTIYENTKEEFIKLTQIHIQSHLQGKLKNEEDIDDLLYHRLANNFIEGILEVARHYKNETWAAHMMQLFIQQYVWGVHSLLK